jgi:hypothetical protein
MSPITALFLLWALSKASTNAPAANASASGPEVVASINNMTKLATSTRNAGFSEEIYYANEGGNVGLYVVWPTGDQASWVMVRVDAMAQTTLVRSGTGTRTNEVARNALRINAGPGDLLPLRMIPPQ